MRRGDDTSTAIAGANAEYDNFLGNPYTAEVYDWTYRRWRKVVIRGMKGPADVVAPATGEEAMATEPFPPNHHVRKKSVFQSTKDLAAQIRQLIVDAGVPLQLSELIEATGKTAEAIKDLFLVHGKSFGLAKQRYGRQFVYGLAEMMS